MAASASPLAPRRMAVHHPVMLRIGQRKAPEIAELRPPERLEPRRVASVISL